MWRSEASHQAAPLTTRAAAAVAGDAAGKKGGEQSYEMYMPGQQADVLYQKQTAPLTTSTVVARAHDLPAEQREHHFEQSSVAPGTLSPLVKPRRSSSGAGDGALGGSAQGKTRHVMSLPTVLDNNKAKADVPDNNSEKEDRGIMQQSTLAIIGEQKTTIPVEQVAAPPQAIGSAFANNTSGAVVASDIAPHLAKNSAAVARTLPPQGARVSSKPTTAKRSAISPETAKTIRSVAISLTIALVTAAAVFIILLLVNPPFVQKKCKETASGGDAGSSSGECAMRSSASIWKVTGLALIAGGAAAAIPLAWKRVGPTVSPMLKMF